jgi:hypothetical protein
MHHPLPPGFDMAKEQYQFADELNNYLDWELDQENNWVGEEAQFSKQLHFETEKIEKWNA